jgi:hypothetical protein
MTHPTYPLRDQQRKAMMVAIRNGATQATLNSIRSKYDRMRDKNFPRWLDEYNAAFERWAASHGVTSAHVVK